MTDNEKWNAVVENDESMDGVFFYCVKSTGIFCRPSCKSKLPRRDNIFFIDTKEEALEKGFRPCKRCRSDLITYKPLKEVANEIKEVTDKHWHDSIEVQKRIRQLGFSEHRLAEIFKEEYGITPNEYISSRKLEYAKKQLTETDTRIVDISFDLDFNALSSFYKFFKEKTGTTPAEYRKRNRKENSEIK